MVTEISGVSFDPSTGGRARSLCDALPTPENGWSLRPFQIVSFWDVIQFPADQFLQASALLTGMSEKLQSQDLSKPAKGLLDSGFRDQLLMIKAVCALMGLTLSVDEVNFIEQRLTDPLFTWGDLCGLLSSVRRRMQNETARQKYLYMPESDAKYYYDPALRSSCEIFSPQVAHAFRLASGELTKGGQCYAAGMDTASVFHMMRALEHGLRALAKQLRVKMPKGKNMLDLQTWGDILRPIEKKVKDIEQRRRSRKRDEDLEFFGGAASQFHYFKTAWRNHVMHAKRTYDHDEAGIVMRHTLEFFEHISARLKEVPGRQQRA